MLPEVAAVQSKNRRRRRVLSRHLRMCGGWTAIWSRGDLAGRLARDWGRRRSLWGRLCFWAAGELARSGGVYQNTFLFVLWFWVFFFSFVYFEDVCCEYFWSLCSCLSFCKSMYKNEKLCWRKWFSHQITFLKFLSSEYVDLHRL